MKTERLYDKFIVVMTRILYLAAGIPFFRSSGNPAITGADSYKKFVSPPLEAISGDKVFVRSFAETF